MGETVAPLDGFLFLVQLLQRQHESVDDFTFVRRLGYRLAQPAFGLLGPARVQFQLTEFAQGQGVARLGREQGVKQLPCLFGPRLYDPAASEAEQYGWVARLPFE